MADFRVRFTSEGTQLEPWLDPPLGDTPTRINPRPEFGHRRHVSAVDGSVEISAVVDGVEAPLDAALGGRLFTYVFAEYPTLSAPPVVQPPGQSSVLQFDTPQAGHYTLRVIREGGGSIFVHVDAESPPVP